MTIYDVPVHIPVNVPVNPNPIQSRDLEKKLLTYVSLSAAAAACVATVAQPATAEVVVTKTNTPINWAKHTKLDLNNDGIPDFVFSAGGMFCCFGYLEVIPHKNNEIIGKTYASALASGVTVGKGANFHGHREVMVGTSVNRTSGSRNYRGPWVNVTTAFLGLAINLNGEPHFGWARLTFTGIGQGTITEYAYETIPGKAIVTGATKEEESPNEAPSDTATKAKSLAPGLGALAGGAQGLELWRK
jgi:hypothetical protein